MKQQVERKRGKKKSLILQTCALIHSCEYLSCPTASIKLAAHHVYWSLGVNPLGVKGSIWVLPTKSLCTWLERLVGH